MPNLITPPAPPATPNVTAEIPTSGGYTLVAGEIRYTTSISRILAASGYDPGAHNYVLTNAGTIWVDFAGGAQVMVQAYWGTIHNSGTIVAHSANGVAETLQITSGFSGLFNSGSIYALSDTQYATAFAYWNSSASFENSGTIAAQGATGAYAIRAFNGGEIVNQAGGQILAEGAIARAIHIGRGHGMPPTGMPPTGIDVLNYGLIEARSTNPDNAAIGILVTSNEHETVVIENHGVIRADVAIYGTSEGTPAQRAPQQVINHAGGLIDGAIFLDLGADQVINRGQITGYVDMGDGNDLFDNSQGQHSGTTNLGWNDDIYLGGAGVDAVTGDRGADTISGGGGNDLLIAGWGNDDLRGDAGNDALYGEGGDDRIVTSGGDLVDGGTGNDRVELGDYQFRSINGGAGHDVLVLPADSRILDLSQLLASGRVSGFEALALADAGRIVIRESDIAALSGGSSLLISRSGATGTIDLAGSWTQGGTQTIGGIAYTSYSSGASQLLIGAGLTVNLGSAPAGATGLDPIAAGDAPPAPGSIEGAVLTPLLTVATYFSLYSDLEIDAAERWESENGAPVIVAGQTSGIPSLFNHGTLTSSGTNGARGITGFNFQTVYNDGSISATSLGGTGQLGANFNSFETYGIYNTATNLVGNAYGVNFSSGAWDFLNAGSITVRTDQAIAVGYLTYGRPGANHGTISASSSHFIAVGAFARNGGNFVNSGTIDADGVWGAYGVASSTHGFALLNSGTISAFASEAGRDGIGVYIYFGSGTQRITNSGLIEGEIAIQLSSMSYGGNLWLDNTGQIAGRIELINANGDDVILNSGTINGSVALGAGRDVYDGTGGVQIGAVRGEAGADILIGTTGRDTLDGGADNDVLSGGGGGDTLTGGAGGDVFIFNRIVPGQAAEVITDFVSGTDRIDLRQLAPSSVTIQGSTITVVAASGTLVIQSSGFVAPSDIITTGPVSITGGAGDDVLIAGPAGSLLSGLEGSDSLIGGAGNDRLDGGAGISDIMVGGNGNDTYVVDSTGDLVVEHADGGYDTVEFAGGLNFYEMTPHVEAIVGGSAFGNAQANLMVGNDSMNQFYGRGGNDTLNGGGGQDYLSGGDGVDRLSGGLGRDEFFGTAAELNGDTIVDFGSGDRIRITDANIDNFTYSLTGNTLTFTGGSLTFENVPLGQITIARSWQGVELSIAPHDPLNDFNGDGRSDILWRSDGGALSNWLGTASGGFAVNDTHAFATPPVTWQVAGTGDFNGDGRDDLLGRGADGWLSIWLGSTAGGWRNSNPTGDPYAGAGIPSYFAYQVAQVSSDWQVAGIGDFDDDGLADILWRSDGGAISNWLGNGDGTFVINDANAFSNVPTNWHVAGTGDYNGDGRDDILWRNDAGQLSNWLGTANGGFTNNDANAFSSVPTNWHVAGTGDFNGDGRDDILWRSDAGHLSNWLGQASGGFANNDANAFTTVATEWQVVSVGDYNGDGRDDILWRNTNGQLSDWLGTASGGFTPNDANAFTSAPTDWHVQPEVSIL